MIHAFRTSLLLFNPSKAEVPKLICLSVMVMTARVESARRMSVEILRLDDSQVCALVDAAEKVGVGIGGTTKNC